MRADAELRRRLRSTADLRALVRTMKLLAAAAVPEFERAVAGLGASCEVVEDALQVALRDVELPAPPRVRRPAAVVFGSDHGLCGPFNEALASFVAAGGPPARILAVGERLARALEDHGVPVDRQRNAPASVGALAHSVQGLLLELDGWRREGVLDVLALVHHRPEPGGVWRVASRQVLPLDPQWLRHLAHRPWPARGRPAGPPGLLPELLRQHLYLALYRAQAEALAGENAARLLAMGAAERSLDERLEELTREYHRQRHHAVTEELLEVVSGYEVLRDGARSLSPSADAP